MLWGFLDTFFKGQETFLITYMEKSKNKQLCLRRSEASYPFKK